MFIKAQTKIRVRKGKNKDITDMIFPPSLVSKYSLKDLAYQNLEKGTYKGSIQVIFVFWIDEKNEELLTC